MKTRLMVVLGSIYFVSCRDFYLGMFKKNDFLVAQDRVYKEKIPFRFTVAKYGRLFKCPITYIRVVDRLGVGRGPAVKITRGGLQKNYVTLNIVSPYNLPISVNIYVGCANNMKPTTKTTVTVASSTVTTDTTVSPGDEDVQTTVADAGGGDGNGEETTEDAGAGTAKTTSEGGTDTTPETTTQ